MTDQIGHSIPLMTRRNRRVWLAKRRHVLGATDAVVILLGNPWRTPLDVWLEKTGRYTDDRDSYPMKRGRILEPLLITEWITQHPTAAILNHAPLLAHPAHRMIAASLDAAAMLDREQVVVEAKTASWRARDDWWDDTKLIPDAYAAQVLIQLAVTGLEVAHVVADIAGDFRTLTIERDRGFEEWALPVLAEWWQKHVVEGEVPDIDPVRDYGSLKRLWVPQPGLTVEADDELMAYIECYQAHTDGVKKHKAHADEFRGLIRIAAKEATVVTHDGEPVATVSKSGALTVKAPT